VSEQVAYGYPNTTSDRAEVGVFKACLRNPLGWFVCNIIEAFRVRRELAVERAALSRWWGAA